ncbi:amino acid/amide ABC transporter membrane protein 1, HAAT family [Desulfomicrobium norvegicum]|uniref:Amino acid/amide ABC transporter membrane protein 1, HAAT family n=1 Tax=Desulfomicrobium norvegicum (strain DSM 1741 / NCIMB 8310) TaxID=52561 RepID=A0A8G2C3I8_DESNO|nr:branched-chain amino acid ABC transporter permease [Desulfomicrobium norvegicum]SFL82789.1 amino acid/amide ABC transporter membrane protein 1, HAAT family [Desulfomicrobium norvegicum]
MDPSSLLQYLITGLTLGSTYGLTALGFTIIFNTTGVINFAQGEFVMLGGMMSVYFMHSLGFSEPAAVVLAVLGATMAGALVERLAIRPVRDCPTINLIIITIGVSIFIRGLAMLLWGKDTHVLEPFSGNQPIMFLGAAIMPQAIWVLVISLFLLGALKMFFSGTIHGKAMLACSFDSKAASLVGIGVQRMVLLSFMISALVGAVGGVILAPITMTSYDVGIMLGLKGFAACILGGLGNPFGAAAGGVILGVLESFGAGFVSSAYKDALAFVILLILLFAKPSGLFGLKDSKRV